MNTLQQRAQPAPSPTTLITAGTIPQALQAFDPRRGAESDAAGLTEIWRTLWQRQLLILCVAVSCGLAAYLISLAQPTLYRAHTSLEIQSLNENFLQIKDIDAATADGYSAEALMDTEVKLLQEDALI